MHWYISFATTDKFLGATVVEGNSANEALANATKLGINPGGEAAILYVPVDPKIVPDLAPIINRLASKEEMRSRGSMRIGDCSSQVNDAFEQAAEIVCEEHNK